MSGREPVYISDAVTIVQLCGLIAGQTYYLQATPLGDCQPVMELPGQSKGKQSVFNFVAESSCQTVFIHVDYLKKGCTGLMYLSYSCTSCAPPKPAVQGSPDMGPIFAVPGIPATTLVNNVFIGGGCFDTENITFAGNALSAGTFSGGMSSIGIETGVILSSGNVALATGPNNQTGAGFASGGGSDPDLSQAANGAAIQDAARLQFDFTPTQSQITFRYVFASEEYCDYVNSGFNDVFGFFLSGPGISGPYSGNAVNIAVLPGGTPVTINNVNHLTNSTFYKGNIPAGDPQLGNPNCAGHPISGPPSTNDCQYDGFTVVLTAVANVIPCETYHIKLAIGDAFDSAFDSAVFLEANSFDAGGDAAVTANVPFTGSSLAYEGCTPGFFFFQRSGGNINMPLVINYTISGTATSGVDYQPLPMSITIPAGQTFFQLPVNIIDDLINEGTETIILTLFNPCSCNTSTATLQIQDPPPVDVTINGAVVCEGLPVVIQPTITGGVQPMSYSWNPNSSGPVYVGFPTQSGVYTVTVTDYCGTQDIDTAFVQVYNLSATLSGTAEVCPGGTPGTLNVSFTGLGPYNLTYIINGANPTTINGITANPYQLQVTQPGTYTIVAITNGQCLGDVAGQGIVTQPQVSLSAAVTDVGCFGEASGAIDLSASGTTAPFTYLWSNANTTEDISGLAAGTYTVTVEDTKNCEYEYSVTVGQPTALTASATVLSGVDCTNPTGGAIDLGVGGGTPDYHYLWNTGDTLQDLSGLTAGQYTVTVTDANGCIQTASVAIQGDTNIPNAEIEVTGVVNCTNTAITLDGSNSSGGQNFVYQWSVSGGGVITGDPYALSITAEGGGNYELLVTDTLNNCFTIASVVVPQDFNYPTADAGPAQVINCFAGEVTLDGSGSSGGANMQYTWTTDTGNFGSPSNIESPTVDAPGTYTLIVLNVSNGCADTSTTLVTADLAIPTADAGDDGEVNCQTPVIQLDGSGSSSGGEFTYLWTTPDGNIAGDSSLLNPTIDQAGVYTLLVTNTLNGCTETDEVVVIDLSIDPIIQIDAPDLLTCAITEISLDATGSDSGPQYSYTWTGINGATVVSGGNTPTPLVGSTGVYELTLLNTATGCVSVDSVEVFDDLVPPLAEAGLPLTIACNLPDMPLDGSGSSSGPNISYSWQAIAGGNIVSGVNAPSPVVNAPGTYVLTVTDANNGCTATDSVDVVLDDNSPSAVANAPQIINCNNPEVVINGLGSSLGPDFNYEWATTDGNIVLGDGTLFLTVDEPGTYILTVTNETNACFSVASITLGIDTLSPTVQIAAPADLTCAVTGILLDGAGSSSGPGFTYAWSTSDGNIVSGGNTTAPEIDEPGAYILLVTNTANGCTESASVQVAQDVVPPVAEAGATAVLNCGITSLSLNGAGSSSGQDFTYAWSTTDGNILSGTTTLTPLVDEPGLYVIEVFNTDNGCSATDQVAVSLDVTPPQAQIAAPGMLTCAVTTLTLNGSPSAGTSPLTFAWSTNDGNISGSSTVPMPVIDQPGVYQLVVTNSGNLCSDTTTVVVAEDVVAPIAEAGPTFELDCGTPSLTLDGAGSSAGPAFSYSWNTLNGIISGGGATLNPMITAAGIYTLTVLNNQNGCSSTDEVIVTLDDDSPVSSAGPAQVLTCALTSLALDGSASSQGADFTYQWTTTGGNIVSGGNTLAPVVNEPGTYILTVTSLLNDCETSSSVIVSENVVPPAAEAGAQATITCTDLIVPLNGGSSSQGPNFSYAWSTTDGNIVSGAGSLVPQVDQPGSYTLLVTNTSNGCTASDATTVLLNQTPPVVSLQPPAVLTCTVTQLNLSASGTSTGPNFSYEWTTADGNITGGGATLSPTINEPGTYILNVTNNQNGCEASNSLTVTEDVAPPAAEAGATAQLTCAVTSLQLNGAGSSAGSGFSYQWTAGPGGVIQSGASTLTPTVTAPATYTLTVLNTGNGCTASDPVTVTQNITPPTVQIGNPPSLTCLVDQVTLDANGSNSGADYTLGWSASGGGNIVSAANPLQPLVNEPGDYTLTIVSQVNGCSASLTVTVNELLDPPGAEAGPDYVLHCNQPTATLQGTSPIGATGEFLWTTVNGAILSGANTAQPVVGSAGAYLLTVINPVNGCESTDEVIVTESFPADFDFLVEPPVCEGFPGLIQFGEVLGGTPPYQYSVSGGFSFSGQTLFTGLEPGTYDLVVTDANDCPLYGEAVIAPGVEVALNVESEVLLDLGESYNLQVFANIDEDDIASITWEPQLFLSCTDCLNPLVTPTQSIDYLVTIVTDEGCEGEIKIAFRVNKAANVFVPTVFSPNGDGENDVFMIFAGNQVAQVRTFMVFDRWGESVFEYFNFKPNDPAFGWDGKFRGADADPAVFAWYAEIEMLDGRVELFEGGVSLVR